MDIKKSKKSQTSIKHKLMKARPTRAIKKRAQSYINGEDNLIETSPKKVTNDSVSKHRKEMLSKARKFKYPLKHSKHRIAIISTVLIVAVVLLFSAFSYSLLYKQQDIGDFAYRVSRILPIPVARVGNSWVRFEEYLFEVRQNAHYLINQENVDFETPEGQEALRALKEAALIRVEDNEIVSQLARQNDVKVSDQEVDTQLKAIREAGGIGEGDKTLEDTLSDFYGWDTNDLKRVVKNQLLKQKIVIAIDQESKDRAEEISGLIVSNEKSFEVAVKEYSQDDLTKDKAGVIGVISRDDSNLPVELIDAAYALKDGEVSGVVVTSFGLHIVKRLETKEDDKIEIAHIFIKWQEPEVFIDQYRQKVEVKSFIEIE